MHNTWLTQTKFVPPRLREDVVLRSRLVDTVRAAVNSRPLTLLSAPAGYGKTTLLASLTDSPLAWVSIDEEDNDPARFFITLLNALQKPDPGFGEGLQSLLSSLENPAGEALCARIGLDTLADNLGKGERRQPCRTTALT